MTKTATLTRMVLPDHTCPFGVRAKEMLEEAGYEVDERILTTRAEVDAFVEDHDIDTTPLVEIDGEVIGGASELNGGSPRTPRRDDYPVLQAAVCAIFRTRAGVGRAAL